MKAVIKEIKQARDLVQEAERILNNLPVDTGYDDQIDKLSGDAGVLGTALDDLADEIERGWKE